MEMSGVMNWSDLGTIMAAFLGSLGGGGIIVRILAGRYLEKVKHEIQHQIESYKTELRKSEFLFQKEFEAASQFISLRYSFLPGYLYREMEWEDVCRYFALRFEEVEKKLTQYRAAHAAALQQNAFAHLSEVIDKVASGKFEVRRDEVSAKGIDLAEEVMKELEELHNELQKAVWSQSST